MLDNDAADSAVDYFHANPVRAHLVERVEDYPGVSSWSAYANDLDEISHTFLDDTAWRRAGALDALRGLYMKTVTVKVSRPPSWDGITASERRAKVRATVACMREEERRAAAERARNERSTPPVESLAKRDPRSRPKHPKPKRRRRKWASGTPEQVAQFHAAYWQMLPAYHRASLQFRETGVMPPFPSGTYPPRIMYAFVES